MGIRGPANTPEFISAQGSMADALKALFGALSAPRVLLPRLLGGSGCGRGHYDPFRVGGVGWGGGLRVGEIHPSGFRRCFPGNSSASKLQEQHRAASQLQCKQT